MSFWKSELGEINGSKENSFAGAAFEVIPNGTTARAFIKNIITKTFNEDKFYQVTWKLIDGDFKDYEVQQKLHVFDSNPKKSFRAKNMLRRFFIMFNCSLPSHDNALSDEDLSVFNSKVAGIKIFEWETEDGKCGNWVGEAEIDTNEFKTQTGKKMERKNVKKSSLNEAGIDDNFNIIQDDSIPF